MVAMVSHHKKKGPRRSKFLVSGLLSLGLAAYLSTALYVSSSTSTAGDIDLLADLGSTAHWPSNAVEALGNPLVKKGKNFVSDAREILFTPDHAGRTLMDEFVDVYKNRPDKVNICGIRINHALALFVAVRHLQPSLVVESGVNAGQSTYFIRAASPTTTIYAIDPEVNPICESIGQGKRWIDSSNRTKNFTGKNFVDIADLDWVALGKEDKVDPRKALVFIDDHLQVLHRLPALMKAGIRHVVVEDNYKIFEGKQVLRRDHFSLLQLAPFSNRIVPVHTLQVLQRRTKVDTPQSNYLPLMLKSHREDIYLSGTKA